MRDERGAFTPRAFELEVEKPFQGLFLAAGKRVPLEMSARVYGRTAVRLYGGGRGIARLQLLALLDDPLPALGRP